MTTPVRNLTAELSEKPAYDEFSVWLVGDTPLITHAWSEKARRATGWTKPGPSSG